MRRIGSAVAGVALLGALAGCAEKPEQVGFGGRPQPAQPAVGHAAVPGGAGGWPAPPQGAYELPPSQIDSAALPPGYPRLVWTQGDGRTVGAYGQEGGCTEVHPEVREQNAQAVRIALVEVTSSPGPCTMDLRFPPVTAQLDTPLEHRTVIIERQTIGPPGS
ncbi:MAG TPA: hypothetical protein VGI84_05170 [Pseudonocardiaceae bacterium]|jgi:hypothetical protein